MVRRGLREIVGDNENMEVAGEATNAVEILQLVRSCECDVVLLDITMPGRNGLEALRDIKIEKPDLPVLLLSIHPEDQYAVRALKAGASGYVTKESAPEELVRAIEKAVAGGRYVSASLAEHLAGEIGGSGRKPHELLSDREFEVLRQIGKWKTVSQIADEMSLSVKTVSTYRSRVLEKLRLKTTNDLIRYVQDHSLE
jgi:DNA-binding NarL/FixJ family response regulator